MLKLAALAAETGRPSAKKATPLTVKESLCPQWEQHWHHGSREEEVKHHAPRAGAMKGTLEHEVVHTSGDDSLDATRCKAVISGQQLMNDFLKGTGGLPSPLDLASHPLLFKHVPLACWDLWLHACKLLLTQYRDARLAGDEWEMKRALIDLLMLPTKILEYRRYKRSRIRHRDINRKLSSFITSITPGPRLEGKWGEVLQPTGSRTQLRDPSADFQLHGESTSDNDGATTKAVNRCVKLAREGYLSRTAKALNSRGLLDPTDKVTRS